MKEYKKPMPRPTPWSKPFWDGCKRHELVIQKCKDCQEHIFYPKLFCPHCLSPNLEWTKASGKGKIYSYTIVYSYAPTEFAEDTPYVVAVIDLQEGVRMMSNVVECPPEEVKCDMKVEVVFDDVTNEITLPKFKPVS
jgi:uncharacterized OB-fold protein